LNWELKYDFMTGLALGYIYYTPSQEYELAEEEEDYESHQFCLLFIVVIITVWRNQY